MIPRDGVRGSFFDSMGESMGTFQIDSRGANGDGSH